MSKELERQVQEGFQALDSALKAGFETRDEWMSRIEAQVNTARGSYSRVASGDHLKHVLPERFTKDIERADVLGIKDPVGATSLCAWWSMWHAVAMEKVRPTRKGVAGLFEELDRLEKGWGCTPIEKAALGEVVGSGANVIATPVEAELWRLIRDNTVVRPLATQIVMSSLTHQIPVENSNVTAYLVPETTVITDAMPTTTFAQKPLTARVLAGLATVSNQLFEDNIIGLQQYLFTAIAEAMGVLEDQGALDGGTPSVQNFSGIAVASGVNSLTVTATSVAGGNIPTYGELITTIFTAVQNASRVKGQFFMLPGAFKNIASLVDTTGQPIFSFGNVPNAIPQFIGGYPVNLVSSLSTAWTNVSGSTSNIYYGPPSKILFGNVGGLRFDIDPYSLMDRIQSRVRVMERVGILVPTGSYFTVAKGVKSV
jgi:HK97 family phage major capsid protein